MKIDGKPYRTIWPAADNSAVDINPGVETLFDRATILA